MKLAVAVNVKGLKDLAKKIDTVEEMKPLRTLLEDASRVGEETSRQYAPSYTGKMAAGFVSEIQPFSATVHTISEKYPVVMEGGRKPGSKMPPPSVLDQWARAHGIENTFVLARAIARRGIKGRFFRRKGRAAVRRELPRLIEVMSHALDVIWGRPGTEGA